jgi:hypothetical protein
MQAKSFAIAAALIMSAPVFEAPFAFAAQASECGAKDKIDNSSADSAMRTIKKAGLLQISGLKKGCDNFWHGQATKDGVVVNISLSPQGQVLTEGD